jgi:hypothetical protein
MTDLIIDFERLNELTSNEKDNPTASLSGVFVFSKSRKAISDMIDIYMSYHEIEKNPSRKKASPELYDLAIQTLYYNRILVSKRELKIDSIILTQEL